MTKKDSSDYAGVERGGPRQQQGEKREAVFHRRR